MEQVDDVLKYIKLYTNCSDHTLKRIKVLLEDMVVTREVVKVVKETKEVYIHKKKGTISFKKWAEQYLSTNELSYNDIAVKNRERDTITKRNKFCVQAYIEGYGASEIGRYLKRHHTTILHCIHKIKRVNK